MFKAEKIEGDDVVQYLKALMKGSAVTRFHQWRTVQRNTVGHHSHGVAMLVCLIHRLAQEWARENYGLRTAPVPFKQLRLDVMVYAALTHDMAEYIVGDVPAPTKRALSIRDVLQAHEDKVLAKLGMKVELSEDEQAIVSSADAFDGVMFCVSEYTLGNRTLSSIPRTYMTYIDQLLGVLKCPGYTYAIAKIRDDIRFILQEYTDGR